MPITPLFKTLSAILCLWLASPAYAEDQLIRQRRDREWASTIDFAIRTGQRQQPKGGYFLHMCKPTYCLRMINNRDLDGFIISYIELTDISDTVIEKRLICEMLDKKVTQRRCTNFDTHVVTQEYYIPGKGWTFLGPSL